MTKPCRNSIIVFAMLLGIWEATEAAYLSSSYSINVLGFTDIEHTRNDGYRYSYAQIFNALHPLNEAGQVIGHAYRYNGTRTDLGQSAWLYNGSSTVNIGLTDAEHTRNDGFRYSIAQFLNEAGQAMGIADRYNGTGTDLGQSVWLYNGSSTVNISLTDAEHTRNDGYRFSQAHWLNGASKAIGIAERYNGTDTRLGLSAWLYNGSSTVNIGLTNAEHTRNDGYRFSWVDGLTESGQAIGYALRYNGTGTDLGQSAWLYNGSSTINIGLSDTEHTRNDGYRYSYTQFLNEAGQAAGYAVRYNGTSNDLGQSAWLYDTGIDQTYAIDLSVRSNGYAFSQIQYLDDGGLALGYYNLYNTDDSFLGMRAFAFTIDEGAVDLGLLVDGGLNLAGWDSLANAYLANDMGQILGYGLLDDGMTGQIVYLLTPTAVPIPPAVILFCSGLLGLVGIARRKKAA